MAVVVPSSELTLSREGVRGKSIGRISCITESDIEGDANGNGGLVRLISIRKRQGGAGASDLCGGVEARGMFDLAFGHAAGNLDHQLDSVEASRHET